MIGKELQEQLKSQGEIYIADIRNGQDLRDFSKCIDVCSGIDEVYHLVGVKGSPKMTKEKPVDFMSTMLQCDINMIMAAQIMKVKKFLYTSSIAVLNPQSDKYPAIAKQTAESFIEAMRIQYPEGTKYCIVRPANVYGRYDNFDNPNAMVITCLVKKAIENPYISVWGDGSEIRDFINAKDVAKGMIICLDIMPEEPINLCSGKGTTIKEVAEAIQSCFVNKPIHYDIEKANGDKKRIMPTNSDLIGFEPEINIEDGISEVVEHARA